MTSEEFLKAAFKGDLEGVRRYVEEGGDIDVKGRNGQTALMLAIWGGRSAPIASLLIERGAEFRDREKSSGWRPLTYAAVNEQTEILEKLLEHGDTIGPDDWKALLYGVQYRAYQTVRMVLERGIDPNLRDEDARTALMRAARSSDAMMLSMLLEHGADANLVDNDGMTALMHAAQKANVDNIRALLDHGADPAMKNKNGQTALDIAREKKKQKVVEELEKV